MRDQCLRKNEVGDARKEQHQTIERDRLWRVVILADPSDRERLKRLLDVVLKHLVAPQHNQHVNHRPANDFLLFHFPDKGI